MMSGGQQGRVDADHDDNSIDPHDESWLLPVFTLDATSERQRVPTRDEWLAMRLAENNDAMETAMNATSSSVNPLQAAQERSSHTLSVESAAAAAAATTAEGRAALLQGKRRLSMPFFGAAGQRHHLLGTKKQIRFTNGSNNVPPGSTGPSTRTNAAAAASGAFSETNTPPPPPPAPSTLAAERPGPEAAAAAADVHAKCLELLGLPPSQRSQQEQLMLFAWLNSFRIFQHLPPAHVFGLTRCIRLVSMRKDQLVFREGDLAMHLYIIISGSVSLWVLKEEEGYAKEEDQPGSPPAGKGTNNSSGSGSNSRSRKPQPPPLPVRVSAAAAAAATTTTTTATGLHIRSTSGSRDFSIPGAASVLANGLQGNVVTTGAGDPVAAAAAALPTKQFFIGILRAGGTKTAFGELGLINGTPRSATIKCEEPTSFLVVDKSDFDLWMKPCYREDLKTKVESLRSFELFRSMSEAYLRRISLYFDRRVFNSGTVLLDQDVPCRKVFFVLRGECEIFYRRTRTIQPTSGKARARSGFIRPRTVVEQVRVALLGKGQMFGERVLFQASDDGAHWRDIPSDEEEDENGLGDVSDALANAAAAAAAAANADAAGAVTAAQALDSSSPLGGGTRTLGGGGGNHTFSTMSFAGTGSASSAATKFLRLSRKPAATNGAGDSDANDAMMPSAIPQVSSRLSKKPAHVFGVRTITQCEMFVIDRDDVLRRIRSSVLPIIRQKSKRETALLKARLARILKNADEAARAVHRPPPRLQTPPPTPPLDKLQQSVYSLPAAQRALIRGDTKSGYSTVDIHKNQRRNRRRRHKRKDELGAQEALLNSKNATISSLRARNADLAGSYQHATEMASTLVIHSLSSTGRAAFGFRAGLGADLANVREKQQQQQQKQKQAIVAATGSDSQVEHQAQSSSPRGSGGAMPASLALSVLAPLQPTSMAQIIKAGGGPLQQQQYRFRSPELEQMRIKLQQEMSLEAIDRERRRLVQEDRDKMLKQATAAATVAHGGHALKQVEEQLLHMDASLSMSPAGRNLQSLFSHRERDRGADPNNGKSAWGLGSPRELERARRKQESIISHERMRLERTRQRQLAIAEAASRMLGGPIATDHKAATLANAIKVSNPAATSMTSALPPPPVRTKLSMASSAQLVSTAADSAANVLKRQHARLMRPRLPPRHGSSITGRLSSGQSSSSSSSSSSGKSRNHHSGGGAHTAASSRHHRDPRAKALFKDGEFHTQHDMVDVRASGGAVQVLLNEAVEKQAQQELAAGKDPLPAPFIFDDEAGAT